MNKRQKKKREKNESLEIILFDISAHLSYKQIRQFQREQHEMFLKNLHTDEGLRKAIILKKRRNRNIYNEMRKRWKF